ncbi:NUDIX hydrolase [uncultured Cohaesibacter sp.]|uniref:NUDIX hydrolase n=1 Tax=uncultured Cohaesibacter sp. TaxID=1002546 RepID=UPI002AAC360D|nr:NUDIX hydrolase [uncultured Cohaesibacter sp.]
MNDNQKQKPRVAVLSLVVKGRHILLVRRANPPDAGKWGFPGGKVEFGETLEMAAQRELFEETGIRARADRILTTLEAFSRDQAERLQFHYVMVAVLCEWQEGEPVAGDDALEAEWYHADDLPWFDLATSEDVPRVAEMAFEATQKA